MTEPKKNGITDTPREGDDWAVGEMTDGTVDSMTEDEARLAAAERDAYDAAFDELLDDDEEDDFSDLDDPLPDVE